MNIAFSFEAPIYEHIGGVQRVTSVLTREFQRRGHKVIFIAFMSNKDKVAYNHHLYSANHNLGNYQFVAQQYYVNLTQSLECIITDTKEIIQEESIDVLIQQDLQTSVFPVLKAIRSLVHVVVVKHNRPYGSYKKEKQIYGRLETGNFLRNLLYKFFYLVPIIPRYIHMRYERQLYRSALDSVDRLCMLSSHFIERLKDFDSSLDYSRIVAISNPNTFDLVSTIASPKEKLVIMVCRMEDGIKNISDFLKAWKKVEQKHPDWKAELIGDGSDLQHLKKLSDTLHLKNVDFVGYQKEVSSYYQRASMLCVCSWFEGWGMIIPEGMAYGCVPICYNTFESLHDLVKNRANGLIVNSNTPVELAEHICFLIQRPDLRENYSAKAKEHIGMFSSAKIAKDWERLFDAIKTNNQ